MRFSFLPSLLAAAATLSGAPASGAPAPSVVVAQLAGVPTSPAFKMEVHKNDAGAADATAIGAKPIEPKASGPHAEEAKVAEKAHAEEAKPAEKTHAEAPAAAPKAVAETAHMPASAGAAASGAAMAESKAAPVDPLERLRQRLAEKLGARPSSTAGGKYVMRVSNRGESGENLISAAHPGAAAVAGAHRAAAQRAAASQAAPSLLPTTWDYAGAGGPEAWSKLQPGFDKCATGARQSPIDIRGGIAVDLEPIRFDYRPSAFSVVDDGHTVQVNVEPGNSITITGRRYELVQFHFHRPSEERIDGRQFDMVAHLVHRDADGHVAIVAVLLDRGSAQPLVQSVWNNLPLEKGDEVRAGTPIDLAGLLPVDRRYYTYMGSLTTPPCSEGVLWMVMKQPVGISADQLAIFSRLYPMNARPIQQASGRLIKQSN